MYKQIANPSKTFKSIHKTNKIFIKKTDPNKTFQNIHEKVKYL